MTGLVATFEISKFTNISLTNDEIKAIEEEITTSFNVTDDEITTNVIYSTTGTMVLSSSDLTDEEVIDSLEAALIEELNLHPSHVDQFHDFLAVRTTSNMFLIHVPSVISYSDHELTGVQPSNFLFDILFFVVQLQLPTLTQPLNFWRLLRSG